MKVTSIRAARVDRGLSQAQVAESLGVSLGTYHRMESDPAHMRLLHAVRLAALLNVSIDDLALGIDSTLAEPIVTSAAGGDCQ